MKMMLVFVFMCLIGVIPCKLCYVIKLADDIIPSLSNGRRIWWDLWGLHNFPFRNFVNGRIPLRDNAIRCALSCRCVPHVHNFIYFFVCVHIYVTVGKAGAW